MSHTLQPDSVEHRFTNGSTALVHRTLPWMVMLRSAALEGDHELVQNINLALKGELPADPAIAVAMNDAVVCAMFIEPRVHPRGAEPPEGEWVVDLVPDSVYGEVLELALSEVGAAASFREDADGAGDGGGGQALADQPEPDAGNGAREPSGVGDRRDLG